MTEPALSEPRWVQDAARAAWREAVLYLRTLARVTLSPGAFVRGWLGGGATQGGEASMNPFGFLATSAALVATATGLVGRWLGRDGGASSVWSDLRASLAPYLYYAALGVVVHAVLRATGSRRRLGSTIALSLYAGGGPASLATLFTLGIAAVARPTSSSLMDAVPAAWKLPVSIVLYAAFLAFPLSFLLALRALHGASWPRTALALAVAIFLLGVLLGRLDVGVGTAHLRFFATRQNPIDIYY